MTSLPYQNTEDKQIIKSDETPHVYKVRIVWRNIFIFIYLHTATIYGIYQFYSSPNLPTFVFFIFLAVGSTQGIGAGVHRLWAHRSYKANLPLRLYLAFFQTLALQNDIFEWCRDHRLHHKFVDTDADPHNINRGFFFAHMGWLLVRKHPDVISKGKTIDLSDLEADPVVRIQRRFYPALAFTCCFFLPALIPWYFWAEKFSLAWNFCGVTRYVLSLHGTWLVNSWAHVYGMRPYDANTKATEAMMVSLITNGEGFHNYHHTFPSDYKAAELGTYFGNYSTALIDFMAKIGWAWDLKTASPELVRKTITRQKQVLGKKIHPQG